MKYPIGIQTFSQIIQNGYVYVDKTDIYILYLRKKIFYHILFVVLVRLLNDSISPIIRLILI